MQFIRNVVKNDPPLPDEITGYFDNRKTYIFLGFNLETWQFRLLLDSLKLKDENSSVATRTSHFPMSYATQSFYQDHFNFVFVEKDVEEFLADLQYAFERKKPPRRNPFISLATPTTNATSKNWKSTCCHWNATNK